MRPPTAIELLEAVRERLEAAVDRPLGGFEARVVRNVVAIVERELELGPAVEVRRAALWDRLGVVSDDELAARIRAGGFDDAAEELRRDLLSLAEGQLAIDNPRWPVPEDQAPTIE